MLKTDVVRPPKLSVIVPTEYHRGQALRCIAAWCGGQTAPPQDYEVIVVAPPAYPAEARADLASLLRPQDRLLSSGATHDAVLCVEGAAVAQAPVLFFTESHVIPEADVVDRTLEVLAARPDWAGFSGHSAPIIPNRLAVVESRMYDDDIRTGMTVHSWRRILDHCFVTRRTPYDTVGGFDGTLGHYAEWALAARYKTAGFVVGYAPEVQVKHFYIGNIQELEDFTSDFVNGEIAHVTRPPDKRGEALIDEPPEWSVRGSFRADLARAIVRQILRSPSLARRPAQMLSALCRWLPIALGGTGLAQSIATLTSTQARLTLRTGAAISGDETLDRLFRRFITTTIHRCRIKQITQQMTNAEVTCIAGGRWSADAPSSAAAAGFHALERHQGRGFRWTEPEAVTQWTLAPGRYVVDIALLPLDIDDDRINLAVFLNGRNVPLSRQDAGTVRAVVDVPPSGSLHLGWTCRRAATPLDRRRLGVPVTRIDWTSVAATARP